MQIVWFVAGLILLVVGAESLVRGAARIARYFGIPSLIIGLTVVAFGTSAPEFAVSLKSAVDGQANIALGNVIGSNIFNILLILGFSAVICPLVVSKQLIRLDVPLMIAVSALVLLLSWDLQLTRLEGAFLFGGLLVYTGLLIRLGRQDKSDAAVAEVLSERDKKPSLIGYVILIVIGLVLLVFGSRLLVTSAVAFAQMLGVSDLVIGLTIVAAGTSLPELVTSVVASLRGERDLAVGNVVGSNLFNLLGVLGLAAIVSPLPIAISPAVLSFDMPLMIAVAFVCLPVFFTGEVISRWEGVFFVGCYVGYTAYLITIASQVA